MRIGNVELRCCSATRAQEGNNTFEPKHRKIVSVTM